MQSQSFVAGDGTVVAAKFAPSGPDHAEGGMSPQSWFALQQKLSSLLGVATGHLQRHAAVVSSAPPIGYVRPVRISRNRAVLLQQIPGHRLSAEAVDRWLDLATDMGFHIGAAFDGEGKVGMHHRSPLQRSATQVNHPVIEHRQFEEAVDCWLTASLVADECTVAIPCTNSFLSYG